jgi:hypothetical protein
VVNHLVQGLDEFVDHRPAQGVALAVVIKRDGADGVVEIS